MIIFNLSQVKRRLKAAKSVGLQTIPSFIRIADDQESLEMALVENIQREDPDPIEIALSYQRLIDEIELTQEELSDRIGKKRSTITNYIRLLRLDPIIQTGMRDGFISMGHGRALITVEDRSKQLTIYEQILAKGLSVRATENACKIRFFNIHQKNTSVQSLMLKVNSLSIKICLVRKYEFNSTFLGWANYRSIFNQKRI